MAKAVIGVETIKIGPAPTDGTMSLALALVNAIADGSVTFGIPEPTKTEISVEDADDPFVVIYKAAAKTFNFGTNDLSNENYARFFGGVITGAIWAAGNQVTLPDQSIEFVSRPYGYVKHRYSYPRVSITATQTGNYTQTGTPVINISGTILTPYAADGTKLPSFTKEELSVGPAAISGQPTNQTIAVGATLNLSVTATNALSYQWYKGSSAIAGATGATYSKANAQSADSGSYSVKVTGNDGVVVTSNAATVTVS